MAVPFGLPLAQADSARVVGDVYGASLLAVVPVVLGAIALCGVRQVGAGGRVLVWRAMVAAMLAAWLGIWLPMHWVAWVVPEGLAAPLIALGRAQMAVFDALPNGPGPQATAADAVDAIFLLYCLGVVGVVGRMVWARGRLGGVLRRGAAPPEPRWRARVDAACRRLGGSREVRVVVSSELIVPLMWGIRRPVVVLPADAIAWPSTHVDAALAHELAHVREHDVLWTTLARVTCALFWFHPAAWWMAARLSTDSELACDDRVLLAGVPRSDYAELLASVAERCRVVHRVWDPSGAACALVRPLDRQAARRAGPSGLRGRLAAILDASRVLRTPSRRARVCAVWLTAVVAVPMATVRIAPTRDVLTMLMHDARWESRAWAVVHLAQRRDSLEMARAAARRDPDPQVRAWASYAIARVPGRVAPFTARTRD